MTLVLLAPPDAPDSHEQGDVPNVTREYQSVSSRIFGASAELRITRDLAAYAVVSEAGGTLITIPDADHGDWLGVDLEEPGDDGDAFSLRPVEIGAVLSEQTVSGQTFRNLPAGAIALAALRQGIGLPIKPGTALIAPPIVRAYAFDGQTIAAVLGDLHTLTGQEFALGSDYALDWTVPAGDVYAPLLCEGADLTYYGRTPGTRGVDAVLAKGRSGRLYLARARAEGGGVPWERTVQVAVDAESADEVAAAAWDALAGLQATSSVYRFGVYRHRRGDTSVNHWQGIRSGTYLHVLIPSVGRRGVHSVMRVLSRRLRDGDDVLEVTAYAITPPSVLALAGAVARNLHRYRPPESLTSSAGAPAGPVADVDIQGMSTAKLRGLVESGQIGVLDAAKIGTGTFGDARIPNLAATKITSGDLDTARLQTNAAAAINAGSGTVAVSKLTSVTASAADLNKTAVAAWEAAATANPQQAAVADTSAVGAQTVTSAGVGAGLITTQAAIDAIQASLDTLHASVNTLKARLRPSGAKIIGT